MYFIFGLILIICICILKEEKDIINKIIRPLYLIDILEISYIPEENSIIPLIIELTISLKLNIFIIKELIIENSNILEKIIDIV